jgi:hypothetical protein
VRIENSLIGVDDMPHSNENVPGHGPIWKLGNGVYLPGATGNWNGISAQLQIHDTIIRVDSRPAEGSLGLPSYHPNSLDTTLDRIPYLDWETEGTCSNNIVVDINNVLTPVEKATYENTGCFEIQTDLTDWHTRVALWETEHPELADPALAG